MLTDSVQNILMIVGAVTVLIVAVCVLCTLCFGLLLLVDGRQGRARFAKHQGNVIRLPTSDDAKFFEDLSEDAAKQERLNQEALIVLKERLTSSNDQTVVQMPAVQSPGWEHMDKRYSEDPFNMKGELLDSRRSRH